MAARSNPEALRAAMNIVDDALKYGRGSGPEGRLWMSDVILSMYASGRVPAHAIAATLTRAIIPALQRVKASSAASSSDEEEEEDSSDDDDDDGSEDDDDDDGSSSGSSEEESSSQAADSSVSSRGRRRHASKLAAVKTRAAAAAMAKPRVMKPGAHTAARAAARAKQQQQQQLQPIHTGAPVRASHNTQSRTPVSISTSSAGDAPRHRSNTGSSTGSSRGAVATTVTASESSTQTVVTASSPTASATGSSPARAASTDSLLPLSPSASSAPPRRVRHWIRGTLLGAGSYGRVYAGIDVDTGAPIALKEVRVALAAPLPTRGDDDTVLSDLAREDVRVRALVKEMQLLSACAHENIIRYHGMHIHAVAEGGESRATDSTPDARPGEDVTATVVIFLEHASGGSLRSLLSSYGALPEALVARYTRDILRGLHYLHARGILHRDVKPANVLLHAGCAKLGDFGCSKLVPLAQTATEEEESTDDVAEHTMVGTTMYAAPEILVAALNTPMDAAPSTDASEDMGSKRASPDSGARPASSSVRRRGRARARAESHGALKAVYGAAADIWSVGITTLEMLTGASPWASAANAVYKLCMTAELPDLPPSLSNAARDFIIACLTRDPRARPSASALLEHDFILGVDAHTLSPTRSVASLQSPVRAASHVHALPPAVVPPHVRVARRSDVQAHVGVDDGRSGSSVMTASPSPSPSASPSAPARTPTPVGTRFRSATASGVHVEILPSDSDASTAASVALPSLGQRPRTASIGAPAPCAMQSPGGSSPSATSIQRPRSSVDLRDAPRGALPPVAPRAVAVINEISPPKSTSSAEGLVAPHWRAVASPSPTSLEPPQRAVRSSSVVTAPVVAHAIPHAPPEPPARRRSAVGAPGAFARRLSGSAPVDTIDATALRPATASSASTGTRASGDTVGDVRSGGSRPSTSMTLSATDSDASATAFETATWQRDFLQQLRDAAAKGGSENR